MDTRKRNVIIGVAVAVLVIVVVLVALAVSGGPDKDLGQDKVTLNTESAATAASDAASKDAGAMRASGDGTADNQVDASEVFGDSSDAAAGKSAGGASGSGGNASSTNGSGSASGSQSGGASSGSGDSSGNGSGGANDNQGTGGADPGVKTEADGSTWTGYY